MKIHLAHFVLVIQKSSMLHKLPLVSLLTWYSSEELTQDTIKNNNFKDRLENGSKANFYQFSTI